jgi:anti-anti-sigma factor
MSQARTTIDPASPVTTMAGIVLRVAGELDLATADDFRASGIRAVGTGRCTVHLDLSAVTFMDAAGVGALVAIGNHADALDGRVVLRRPSGAVRRILDLTGLRERFEGPKN